MCPQTAGVKKRQEPAVALMLSIAVLGVEPGNIHVGSQPRSQGFFLRKWEGREKALALIVTLQPTNQKKESTGRCQGLFPPFPFS